MVKKKSKDMDDGMCEVIIQSMFKRRFKVYARILNTKLLDTSTFRKTIWRIGALKSALRQNTFNLKNC